MHRNNDNTLEHPGVNDKALWIQFTYDLTVGQFAEPTSKKPTQELPVQRTAPNLLDCKANEIPSEGSLVAISKSKKRKPYTKICCLTFVELVIMMKKYT